jgi:uncharacterized membrane protein YkvI
MDQFQQTVSTLRFTFLLNILIYASIFIFLIIAFFYGSKLTLDDSGQPIWGGAIAITSLIVLGIMIYRNPVREITQIAGDLAKVQIILQGYNRQINQVDTAFKQAVLSGTLNVTMLNKSLDHLQEAIDNNVENITHSMEDIEL